MNKDYYAYLTQRLDKGTSKNPVVKEAKKRIKEIAKRKPIIHITDIGCFSGSVINRIYEDLPIKLRNKIRLIGIDNDRESLDKGRKNYPAIIFVVGDLKNKIPLIEQYDIAILSNVLHEIYAEKFRESLNALDGTRAVKSAIRNAINLLNKNGYLVILDGIKPPLSSKSITVEFANDLIFKKYFDFAKRYRALPIKVKRLSSRKIKTTIGSLAAFMTKARYLNESYWKQESLEPYQYFTAKDFEKILTAERMKIAKFELQNFSKMEIKKQIESIKPNIEVPAKNVLIVAQKF